MIAQNNMPSWATVTTLKEDLNTTIRFIAHHLSLGASEVHVFFDNPDDPAFEVVSRLPKVHAVRCDDAHWAKMHGKSQRQEVRQVRNANLVYHRTKCDWIMHLDADELLYSELPIAAVLKFNTSQVIRVKPWEILVTPNPEENGYVFKGGLRQNARAKRIAAAAFGEYANCLRKGMLSHAWGKHFVRTRLPGVSLGIHAPLHPEGRAFSETTLDIKLLHFHGDDFDKWVIQVPDRIKSGGYNIKYQQQLAIEQGRDATLSGILQRLIDEKGIEGLAHFYRAVCAYGPEKEILKNADALFRVDLNFPKERNAFLPNG